MAKEFFKDLPNTTTPLTATRLNGLLDGEEALGNLVVDSIKSKNLADPNQFVSGAIAVNSTSEATDGNKNAVTTGWIPCEPNTTYIISGGHNRLRWQTKASNGTITFAQDGGTTLTTNATAHWLRCYCYYASSNIDPSSITDIQIEKGSTASTFSPYQNLDCNENYSTGEIVIGTWINGKPLYRKVIQFTTTSTSYSMATIGAPANNVDICMIDNAHSYIIDTNNNGIIYMVNTMRAGSDTTVMNTGIHNWFRINADKKIAYTVGSLLTNMPCTLTLEYTKTTD